MLLEFNRIQRVPAKIGFLNRKVFNAAEKARLIISVAEILKFLLEKSPKS